MGLFTSICPSCHSDINWFLDPPKDYVCKCGVHVPPDIIEASWRELYSNHLKTMIREELAKCSDRSKPLKGFNEKMVDEVRSEFINN